MNCNGITANGVVCQLCGKLHTPSKTPIESLKEMSKSVWFWAGLAVTLAALIWAIHEYRERIAWDAIPTIDSKYGYHGHWHFRCQPDESYFGESPESILNKIFVIPPKSRDLRNKRR